MHQLTEVHFLFFLLCAKNSFAVHSEYNNSKTFMIKNIPL